MTLVISPYRKTFSERSLLELDRQREKKQMKSTKRLESFGVIKNCTTNIDWSNSNFPVESKRSHSHQFIRVPCARVCIVWFSYQAQNSSARRIHSNKAKLEQNLQEYFVSFKQELILSTPVERKKVQEPTTLARNILNETKETGGEMVEWCSVKKLKK